jgi:hypothetical protein
MPLDSPSLAPEACDAESGVDWDGDRFQRAHNYCLKVYAYYLKGEGGPLLFVEPVPLLEIPELVLDRPATGNDIFEGEPFRSHVVSGRPLVGVPGSPNFVSGFGLGFGLSSPSSSPMTLVFSRVFFPRTRPEACLVLTRSQSVDLCTAKKCLSSKGVLFSARLGCRVWTDLVKLIFVGVRVAL